MSEDHGGAITLETTERWRRTPEQLTELAREHLMGAVMVVNDRRAIESAFYMILAMLQMAPGVPEKVGALIGRMGESVPGRAMNGYPIFYSVGFVHADDLDAYRAELERLRVAIGLPPEGEA